MLEPLGAELVLAPATDEATLVELAASVDALLVCYAPIPRSVVEAAAGAGCRVIARTGIGYDNVDVEAATEHGIVVTNVPDYCLDEVADQTFLLLLACTRRLSMATDSVRAGGWSFDRGIHRLRGRRLALLGYGRIGRKVAERALAFGLDVSAYDPLVPAVEPPVWRAETLEEALARGGLHLAARSAHYGESTPDPRRDDRADGPLTIAAQYFTRWACRCGRRCSRTRRREAGRRWPRCNRARAAAG